MHKYSRGGWMSGWDRNTLDSGLTVARVAGTKAWLDFELLAPAQELVLRAKGTGTIGLAIDKGPSKTARLQSEYNVLRIPLAKPLAPGRHRITLRGRKSSVDWLWLSEGKGLAAPAIARTEGAGDTATLLAPTPRSYSFYLNPAAGAHLEFETQGEKSATFEVVAQQDGSEPTVVASGKVGSQQDIDFAPYAGQPTRLTLRSHGGAMRWLAPRLSQPRPTPVSSSHRPKNVIVLLIDTQRADSFSVVSKTGGIGAKAYESLVKTSTTFSRAYNNENWTKPSIASLDTAVYPTTHLARWRKDRVSKDLVFFSEHLQKQGFLTQALVANLSAGPKFGFDQGWNGFEKTDNAEQTFGRALSWLGERDTTKPYFLYIQTIDPHVPYDVPAGMAEKLFGGPYHGPLGPSFEQSEEDGINDRSLKLSANDTRWARALYDAESIYQDRHLGIFLEQLRKRDMLSDTAFVVLNDHGEEFGEHKRWGHGWTMGDALFRSPLLMHMPGYFPATMVTDTVEHIDVAPTLVDALGLPPMPSAQGESLLPRIQGRDSFKPKMHSALLFGRPQMRAIVVGDYKLILRGTSKVELFNIADDVEQTVDLVAARPIARRLLETALGEAIANPKKGERLYDRSQQILPRPEYIDEKPTR